MKPYFKFKRIRNAISKTWYRFYEGDDWHFMIEDTDETHTLVTATFALGNEPQKHFMKRFDNNNSYDNCSLAKLVTELQLCKESRDVWRDIIRPIFYEQSH